MHPFELQLAEQWPVESWCDLTTLVAVSGGADSVALLRALVALRNHFARDRSACGRLVVAHFNHGLRGEESQADEQFVRELAASLGIPCEVGRAESSDPTRVSEDSARTWRYQFLTAAALRHGARYVALAHTRDDQVETILFRVLRGTGVSGLAGMPRARTLHEAITLIRPALRLPRNALRQYLSAIGQAFREDASNRDLRFARNRLRHELLPRLIQSQPAIDSQLLSLGERAGQVAAIARTAARKILAQAVEYRTDGFRVHVGRIDSANRQALREMFVELWRQFAWPRGAMNADRWESLVRLLFGPDCAAMFPGAIRVQKTGDLLEVIRL